jgi:hypothetical protein
MAFTKKGTPGTETIVGAAASALKAGLNKFTEAVESVSKLDQMIEERTLKIAQLDASIVEKKEEMDRELASKKFETDLAFKTNVEEFGKKFMTDRNLATITNSDLSQIQGQLAQTKRDFDQEVAKQVASQVSEAKKTLEHQFQIKELESQSSQAQMKAQLDQKQSQIVFLESQLTTLREELKAQRELTQEVAKSSSIGTLNLGGNARG